MTAFASRASGHPRRPSAEPWVLRWARWYTRDLDQQVRQDRLDELASDLWEQRSAARRRGASGVGAAMIGRAARGVPGDLAWRHDELRADPDLRGIARGWTRSGLLGVTYLIAASALLFAAFVWARVLSAAGHHLYLPSATTLTSLGVAVVAVICGAVMLANVRHRWLGALWVGLGVVLSLHFGFVVLWTLSATVFALVTHATTNGAQSFVTVLYWMTLAAIGLFFAILAAAWAPGVNGSAR